MNTEQIQENAVYKFYADCGRQGDLQGLFIAKKEHVKYLIESKIEVYFGEVLGKHSEVYGPIEEHEITFVSDSQEVIDIIKKFNLESGYNPFDYTAIKVPDDEQDLPVLEIIEKRLSV